ncbi:MAG: amidohydrolase family protein [Bacteriovorax sp.]
MELFKLSTLLIFSIAQAFASQFDGGGYQVIVCNESYAGQSAKCTLSGSGKALRFKGLVISNGTLFVGGELRVSDDGRITHSGCAVPSDDAVSIECPGALISAGLINLHEHIEYSYQQTSFLPAQKWKQRNDWRKLTSAERGFDVTMPEDLDVRAEVSERAMLRHALSGTTALLGARNYLAFTRNLKMENPILGTPSGLAVIDSTFPLKDFDFNTPPLEGPCDQARISSVEFKLENPFAPHVGEGTTKSAGFEVDCLLDAVKKKTSPTAFIHGIAISKQQISRLKEQNISVVLSPRSNFSLYGTTAPVKELKEAGVTLAMGTDWSPSGSLTMFDELRCLARYNRDQLNDFLSPADLHRMATENGAKAVGLNGQVGRLDVGELADLILIDSRGAMSLKTILDQTALPDILAVFVGGRGASFPTNWADILTKKMENCAVDPRNLCGQSRMICGASSARPIAKLIQQSTYTIDEEKLCAPRPTDDCVIH